MFFAAPFDLLEKNVEFSTPIICCFEKKVCKGESNVKGKPVIDLISQNDHRICLKRFFNVCFSWSAVAGRALAEEKINNRSLKRTLSSLSSLRFYSSIIIDSAPYNLLIASSFTYLHSFPFSCTFLCSCSAVTSVSNQSNQSNQSRSFNRQILNTLNILNIQCLVNCCQKPTNSRVATRTVRSTIHVRVRKVDKANYTNFSFVPESEYVSPYFNLLLSLQRLIRSGDIESNPGPTSQDHDRARNRNEGLSNKPSERCDLQVISLNVRGLNEKKKVRHLINR